MDYWSELYERVAGDIDKSIDTGAVVRVEIHTAEAYKHYVSAVHAIVLLTTRYNVERLGQVVEIRGEDRYGKPFMIDLVEQYVTDHPL